MTSTIALVTGGAGFIGSHLVEALLARGEQVCVLDTCPFDRARNLDPVRNHPNLTYIEGDIRNREALDRFLRPDASVIYHLASVVGVRRYMTDPFFLVDVVVMGTRTIAEFAARHGIRLLFASTSEVYGKNPAVPWSEDGDRVLGPTSIDRWSYSSSKAVCEHMLYGLYRAQNLKMSIVRFFNVYGPRQNPIFVVSQSVCAALKGEQILQYDGGSQTRCFTYISDIVDGVLRAAASDKAVGEVINIGNSVETEIREVIEEIVRASGTTSEVVNFDTRQEFGERYEDIIRRVPATDKAARLLGWRASTTLAEGIAKTVEWARVNPWWLDGVKE